VGQVVRRRIDTRWRLSSPCPDSPAGRWQIAIFSLNRSGPGAGYAASAGRDERVEERSGVPVVAQHAAIAVVLGAGDIQVPVRGRRTRSTGTISPPLPGKTNTSMNPPVAPS